MIHRCRIGIRRAGQYNDIVCTTDTDSDISRIVCESKQRAVSYSRPRIAPAIAEDCYDFAVLPYFFFRPQIFRRPWADFRETLPHDAVCSEIFYVLYGCSYVPP